MIVCPKHNRWIHIPNTPMGPQSRPCPVCGVEPRECDACGEVVAPDHDCPEDA